MMESPVAAAQTNVNQFLMIFIWLFNKASEVVETTRLMLSRSNAIPLTLPAEMSNASSSLYSSPYASIVSTLSTNLSTLATSAANADTATSTMSPATIIVRRRLQPGMVFDEVMALFGLFIMVILIGIVLWDMFRLVLRYTLRVVCGRTATINQARHAVPIVRRAARSPSSSGRSHESAIVDAVKLALSDSSLELKTVLQDSFKDLHEQQKAVSSPEPSSHSRDASITESIRLLLSESFNDVKIMLQRSFHDLSQVFSEKQIAISGPEPPSQSNDVSVTEAIRLALVEPFTELQTVLKQSLTDVHHLFAEQRKTLSTLQPPVAVDEASIIQAVQVAISSPFSELKTVLRDSFQELHKDIREASPSNHTSLVEAMHLVLHHGEEMKQQSHKLHEAAESYVAKQQTLEINLRETRNLIGLLAANIQELDRHSTVSSTERIRRTRRVQHAVRVTESSMPRQIAPEEVTIKPEVVAVEQPVVITKPPVVVQPPTDTLLIDLEEPTIATPVLVIEPPVASPVAPFARPVVPPVVCEQQSDAEVDDIAAALEAASVQLAKEEEPVVIGAFPIDAEEPTIPPPTTSPSPSPSSVVPVVPVLPVVQAGPSSRFPALGDQAILEREQALGNLIQKNEAAAKALEPCPVARHKHMIEEVQRQAAHHASNWRPRSRPLRAPHSGRAYTRENRPWPEKTKELDDSLSEMERLARDIDAASRHVPECKGKQPVSFALSALERQAQLKKIEAQEKERQSPRSSPTYEQKLRMERDRQAQLRKEKQMRKDKAQAETEARGRANRLAFELARLQENEKAEQEARKGAQKEEDAAQKQGIEQQAAQAREEAAQQEDEAATRARQEEKTARLQHETTMQQTIAEQRPDHDDAMEVDATSVNHATAADLGESERQRLEQEAAWQQAVAAQEKRRRLQEEAAMLQSLEAQAQARWRLQQEQQEHAAAAAAEAQRQQLQQEQAAEAEGQAQQWRLLQEQQAEAARQQTIADEAQRQRLQQEEMDRQQAWAEFVLRQQTERQRIEAEEAATAAASLEAERAERQQIEMERANEAAVRREAEQAAERQARAAAVATEELRQLRAEAARARDAELAAMPARYKQLESETVARLAAQKKRREYEAWREKKEREAAGRAVYDNDLDNKIKTLEAQKQLFDKAAESTARLEAKKKAERKEVAAQNAKELMESKAQREGEEKEKKDKEAWRQKAREEEGYLSESSSESEAEDNEFVGQQLLPGLSLLQAAAARAQADAAKDKPAKVSNNPLLGPPPSRF